MESSDRVESGAPLSKRAKLSTERPTSDFLWCDDKVGYKNLQNHRLGIGLALKYEKRTPQDQKSIEDTRKLIDNTTELRPRSDCKFLLYKGFKAALNDLLAEIKNSSHPILLVHGIPQLGKTSLAMCLAYYLALEGDSAAYVRMDCTLDLDKDLTVESVSHYFGTSKWVVLDECDMNSLEESCFLQRAAIRRENTALKMPLIMFTSGCSIPQTFWMESNVVKFKVISMCVDEAVVDDLKKLYGTKNEVNSKDVLKVSKTFGHVNRCLQYYSDRLKPEEVSLETLQETVFPLSEIGIVNTRSEGVWLLWPEMYQITAEEINRNSEPGNWRIKPCQVQYLPLLLTGTLNREDENVNAVLNWFNISGEKSGHEEQAVDGYCSYEANTYFYYFPHLERLRPIILEEMNNYTPQKLYVACIDVYKKVGKVKESNAQCLRGMLFKNLVELVCDIHTVLGRLVPESELHTPESKKGVVIVGERYGALAEVDEVCHVTGIDKLCEKAVDIFEKETAQNVWCSLYKVQGASQSIGYDFAYVSATATSKSIQLIKATVNPVSHPKGSMKIILDRVKDECKSYEAIVDGFFLVPTGLSHAEQSGGFSVACIDLPD